MCEQVWTRTNTRMRTHVAYVLFSSQTSTHNTHTHTHTHTIIYSYGKRKKKFPVNNFFPKPETGQAAKGHPSSIHMENAKKITL